MKKPGSNTREDLVRAISKNTGVPQYKAEQMLNAVLGQMKTFFKAAPPGAQLILRNFGIFRIHRTKKRIGRNPKTGVEAIIEPRNVVKFKASKNIIEEET